MTVVCKIVGTKRVTVNGLEYVVHKAAEVVQRTGKGRHWARYLTGWLADAAGKLGTRFSMSLGPVLPAELRAYLKHFPEGWAALQSYLDQLVKRMDVIPMLSICDEMQQFLSQPA